MNIKKNDSFKTVLDVVLSNMGMSVESFLEAETKSYYIKGLTDMAKYIRDAIFAGDKITVVGDYDADGITATSILSLMFNALGVSVTTRLPHRFSEGYGLSEKIIDEISDGLLITVDNGISAVAAIDKAKAKGLTVLVLDHHLAPEDGILPNADVIVDPNAIENTATFNSYCGAGLAYKLAVEMLGESHILIPKLLSLAAIGTVADVMPLVEDNRNIVREGLKAMTNNATCPAGLSALLNESALEKYLTAKNIAFKIGPIANAPGRLYDDGAEKALKLLSFDGNSYNASLMATELSNDNERRKSMVKEFLPQVEAAIAEDCLYGDAPMTIYVPNLPEGLVGIFAGRICEEYSTPTIILTDSEDPAILKGSARSCGGVHLKNLLDAHADLLLKYGGHAEAAGLSIEKSKLLEFREAIQEGVAVEVSTDEAIAYDLEIDASQINETIEELEKYAPYGEGNPEPVFLIKNMDLYPEGSGYYKAMGEEKNHLKLFGKDASGIGFDMVQKYLDLGEPKKINLVGTLSRNAWHSRISNQIEIIDFESAETETKKTPMAALLEEMAKNRYK